MKTIAGVILGVVCLVFVAVISVILIAGSISGSRDKSSRLTRESINQVDSGDEDANSAAALAVPNKEAEFLENGALRNNQVAASGGADDGNENSGLGQAPVSDENRGWTHIPWLVGKPREAVEKNFGDPQNTNENVTTPVWSYWKGEEELRVGYNAIVTDELLGQGRTFRHPMVVAGVSYNPHAAEVKVREIIPLELANKPPHYRVLFHEKRQYNPTNRFIVTWVNDGVMIVVESRTASSATSEERYYNRERGLHEWRYRINEEVIRSWVENQVESYRQERIGVRQDDPRYGKPNEITGHIHIGKGGDWEVYF